MAARKSRQNRTRHLPEDLLSRKRPNTTTLAEIYASKGQDWETRIRALERLRSRQKEEPNA